MLAAQAAVPSLMAIAGIGGERNPEEASRLLSSLAEKGHVESMVRGRGERGVRARACVCVCVCVFGPGFWLRFALF
jgi:hypothetical protein